MSKAKCRKSQSKKKSMYENGQHLKLRLKLASTVDRTKEHVFCTRYWSAGFPLVGNRIIAINELMLKEIESTSILIWKIKLDLIYQRYN